MSNVQNFHGDPPPVTSYHGQPVAWLPWKPGLRITHIDTTCEECGEDPGPRWMAWGLVNQGLGTVPDYRFIPGRGRRAGTTYKYGRKPKPPLRQLAASRCPACGSVDVIDMCAPDALVWSSTKDE